MCALFVALGLALKIACQIISYALDLKACSKVCSLSALAKMVTAKKCAQGGKITCYPQPGSPSGTATSSTPDGSQPSAATSSMPEGAAGPQPIILPGPMGHETKLALRIQTPTDPPPNVLRDLTPSAQAIEEWDPDVDAEIDRFVAVYVRHADHDEPADAKRVPAEGKEGGQPEDAKRTKRDCETKLQPESADGSQPSAQGDDLSLSCLPSLPASFKLAIARGFCLKLPSEPSEVVLMAKQLMLMTKERFGAGSMNTQDILGSISVALAMACGRTSTLTCTRGSNKRIMMRHSCTEDVFMVVVATWRWTSPGCSTQIMDKAVILCGCIAFGRP